jgi:hypothetical protein
MLAEMVFGNLLRERRLIHVFEFDLPTSSKLHRIEHVSLTLTCHDTLLDLASPTGDAFTT